MPHVEGHAQRRRMGVVVPVCNGTNYRVQAGLMQLVNAALLATSLRSVAFFEEHAYHSDPATHWNPLFGVLGRNATQAVLSVEQGVPCV